MGSAVNYTIIFLKYFSDGVLIVRTGTLLIFDRGLARLVTDARVVVDDFVSLIRYCIKPGPARQALHVCRVGTQ